MIFIFYKFYKIYNFMKYYFNYLLDIQNKIIILYLNLFNIEYLDIFKFK